MGFFFTIPCSLCSRSRDGAQVVQGAGPGSDPAWSTQILLSGVSLGLLCLPRPFLLLQPFLSRELPLVSQAASCSQQHKRDRRQGQGKFQGLSSPEPAIDCSCQGQSQD